MSASAVTLLLQRAALEHQAGAAAHKHIVITRDSATGAMTHCGPYDTGLAALTSAHTFLQQLRAGLQDPDTDHPHLPFTVTVAPLSAN